MGSWGATPDGPEAPKWLPEHIRRQCVATEQGWAIPRPGSKPANRNLEVIVAIRDLINKENDPDAPLFISEPPLEATEDVEYRYSITTSDVDTPYDGLTITAPTLPSWLELVDSGNGLGLLYGTPGASDVGEHDVVIRVSDGDLTEDQEFTVVVAAAEGGE